MTTTPNTTTTDEQEAVDRAAQQATDERPRETTEQRPLTTADISRANDQRAPRTESSATENKDTKRAAPLFAEDAATELRDRWTDVQTGFVDEPRKAVEQADTLVAEVMKRLADGFATERQALERQWSKGDDVSTEELRISLRRYRSFFDRLLSV